MNVCDVSWLSAIALFWKHVVIVLFWLGLALFLGLTIRSMIDGFALVKRDVPPSPLPCPHGHSFDDCPDCRH